MSNVISTVEAHLQEGRITRRRGLTSDALEFAATWLEAYEGDDEEDRENLRDLATVAAYLRRRAAQRRRVGS